MSLSFRLVVMAFSLWWSTALWVIVRLGVVNLRAASRLLQTPKVLTCATSGPFGPPAL
jgi:hypothetical protein